MAKGKKKRIIVSSIVFIFVLGVVGIVGIVWYKDTHKVYTLEEITNGKINQAAYVMEKSTNYPLYSHKTTLEHILFTKSEFDCHFMKVKTRPYKPSREEFNEMIEFDYIYYDENDNVLFTIYPNDIELYGLRKFVSINIPKLEYHYSFPFKIEVDGETESYAVINYE